MKCTIPEISWHNRDPVLSVDLQPVLNTEFYRLASGGTDSHVLIWHLRVLETGAMAVEAVSDLTRHQRAVNVVRWSPTGQYLASGDDDANIIVWQQKADELAVMLEGETADKEKWSVFKVLRGHKEDVYDISWSPNSSKLLSGSVDNTAIIWDLAKGNNDNILKDHKGFVQGVSWDPHGDFIATLSSDRTCRIFNETGKQVKCRMSKGTLELPENHPLHGQVVRYYHDDTLKSFFRRLAFSPDGNLLVTPAGCLDSGQPNKPIYTTYIYTTNSFTQPAAVLPSPGQYTIAVRCCPVLFELRSDGPDPIISLPYRMIIAVATRSSVVLYDTQQLAPFAVISNIHYTRLTDLTWSQDGKILAVSSTDGFCSLVTFENNELGTEYVKEESDEENIDQSICEEVMVENIEDKTEECKKEEKKRPSFLKQWAMKSTKTDEEKKENSIKERNTNIIVIDDSPKKSREQIDSQTNVTGKEMVVNQIAVRRKPREIDMSDSAQSENTSKTLAQTKNTTPVKQIAVRKKKTSEQKETTKTVPVKTISVRKKPRENAEMSSPSTKNSTPNKPKNKDTHVEKNATPAKPIAVRRKPRDQMDIMTFLKSPNEPPPKKIALDSKTNVSLSGKECTVMVSEDSVANDSWVCSEKVDVDEPVIFSDVIMVEDSQDIKLVLEETTADIHEKHSSSLEDFEKFHEMQNKVETNNPNDNETTKEETSKKSVEINDATMSSLENEAQKIVDSSSEIENSASKLEACHKIEDNLLEKGDTSQNTNKDNTLKDETSLKLDNTVSNKESKNYDTKLESEKLEQNCDLVNSSNDKNPVVNDIKNKINELQIHPGSLQKKKVPFVTLSSPKSKKRSS